MGPTSLENNAVETIFAEQKDFIIIGLTGRTGCGCSTVAKLLCMDFNGLQPPMDSRIDTNSDRQNKIVYDYAKTAWTPFRLIEMKHIIFTFVLEYDCSTADGSETELSYWVDVTLYTIISPPAIDLELALRFKIITLYD